VWLRPDELRAGAGSVTATLTVREAAVLEVLLRHPRQVLTRTAIADAAWEGTLELRSNVVDVHVRSLRRKLERPGGPRVVETVRGLGYRLGDQDS
jgi:two-component system OmpR family response regulator